MCSRCVIAGMGYVWVGKDSRHQWRQVSEESVEGGAGWSGENGHRAHAVEGKVDEGKVCGIGLQCRVGVGCGWVWR